MPWDRRALAVPAGSEPVPAQLAVCQIGTRISRTHFETRTDHIRHVLISHALGLLFPAHYGHNDGGLTSATNSADFRARDDTDLFVADLQGDAVEQDDRAEAGS
jgi:hypothetical protein